jgi:uncharacterized membrane protein
VRTSRPTWIAVLDIVSAVLLIQYLLGGRHHASLRLVAVLVWVVFVVAITLPEVRRSRRARHAESTADPAKPSGVGQSS